MAQQSTSDEDRTVADGVSLRDKWQIPLLALSVACFIAAIIYAAWPRGERLSATTLVQQIETAMAAGQNHRTDELCTDFLRDYPTDESLAHIHEVQGDANFNLALQEFEDEAEYLKKAARSYRSANDARPAGLPSATVLLKLGRTNLQLGNPEEAIACYDVALASAPAQPLPIYMAKIEALRSLQPTGDSDAALKVIGTIRTELPELTEPQKAMVALEEAAILNSMGKHAEAETKLQELLGGDSGAAGSKRFLIQLANTQALAGRPTKALDTLREIIESPSPRSAADEALRGQAFLMTAQVYYGMKHCDKALEWFARTADEYPDSDEALAARLGVAQTYLELGEKDRASLAYADIAPELRKLRPRQHRWIDLNAARQVLKTHSETSDLQGRYREALDLVMLEQSILKNPDRDVLWRRASILCRLAEEAAAEAQARGLDEQQQLAKRNEAERAWREAGNKYLYMAEQFDGTTQKEYPDDLWLAIDCYLLAGDHDEAVKVLIRFIREVKSDSRVPQARLELARQYQALGQWDEAITTLDELIEASGTTLPGFEGVYLKGQALVRKGPEFYQQAEEAFLSLLENSKEVDPRSMWYQKSLLELGRLLHGRQQYDQAIIRLNEYVRRYPEDPDVLSAMYLLASSRRNQGLRALAQSREAVRPAEKQELQDMHRQKLESAADEFRLLIRRYEELPSPMSELRRREYQNILFDLADSLHDLGQIEEAIKVYNVIAYRFESSPCVMSAYVKLALAFLDMGRRDQYLSVLERARWTLDKIPEEAFVGQLGTPGKPYWENWIRTMQVQ